MFVAKSNRAVVLESGLKVYKIIKGEVRKGGGERTFLNFFIFIYFFTRLTAVPSEK